MVKAKIQLTKNDIHSKFQERTFYFEYQNSKLTTVKSKQKQKVRAMLPIDFSPILKEILQSPIIIKNIKKAKDK